MSHEPPKLYVNKPKKAQLKDLKHGHQQKVMESSTQATAASKPPEPPRESFFRRYRFLVPLLLGVNLFVGVYVLTRSKTKRVATDGEEEEEVPVAHQSETPATLVEKTSPSPPPNPVKKREPTPETRQRELFKWMLEEKRKIKPNDVEEKKRLDEEKAVLKQFIRAKTIPPI